MNHDALTNEEISLLSQPPDAQGAAQPFVDLTHAPASDCQPLAELHHQFADVLTEILVKSGAPDARCRLREAMLGTYGQFVFGQTIPTCCAVIRAASIGADFYVAMEPSILYPILDAMVGAFSREPPPQRPMTEIEAVIAKRLLRQILGCYSQSFERVLSLELVVDRLEHNAQRLKGFPGGEPVFLATYDIVCRSDFGRLTFCLPWHGTQKIRQQLAAR